MNGIRLDKQNATRVYYLDILRIISTFAVVMIHITASKWESFSPNTLDWQIFNIYNAVSRFAVPVFVMISGALFLNRDYSIKHIFKKNILRIVTTFGLWSALYGTIALLLYKKSLKIAVGQTIIGHFHMWFLFMIVGLYIAYPLLKKITESEQLTKYFLVTSVIFSFIIPQGVKIVELFSQSIADSMNVIIGNVNFQIAVGYSGYFVLGYFLSNMEFSDKVKKIIYALGVFGFVSTIALTALASVFKGELVDAFGDCFTINVLLEAVGIFVFMKNRKLELSEKAGKRLNVLSKCTFGVYLMHPMVYETVTKFVDINVLSFNTAISIPVFTLVLTLVCFAFSAILNKIPVVKKYMV